MRCAACERESNSLRTSEWIAATKTRIETVPVAHNVYRVKDLYRGQPFALGICEDCYWGGNRRRALRYAVVMGLVLLIFVTPILLGLASAEDLPRHTPTEKAALALLRWMALILLPGLWILFGWGFHRWFRNNRLRVETASTLLEVSHRFAKGRMRELGCDHLFTPQEWQELNRDDPG